jgi:hypothetical protein
MLNNRIFAGTAAVLIIFLGIQTYMIFQLNGRLKQLSGQENLAGSAEIKISKPPNLTFPKPGTGDELFKDHP